MPTKTTTASKTTKATNSNDESKDMPTNSASTKTTADIDVGSLPEGLGGIRPLELPATRYKQGGRTHYHVAVPLAEVTRLVQRPDPSRPLPGNRRVDASRAKRFAEYLVRNEDWVSPAILLKVPVHDLEFVTKADLADKTAWGVLLISADVLTEIMLLDGQHRTLGVFIALEQVNDRIKAHRATIRKIEQNQEDKKVLAAERQALNAALKTRTRLVQEHISVDLVEVNDVKARQIFGDINNNARGVSTDFRTILDQRDPVNRIARELIDNHPLLQGRVELGQGGRMSAHNPNLLGAKSVADIVRSVTNGIGRITVRQTDELAQHEAEAKRDVERFLTLLAESFAGLNDVLLGKSDGKQLRQTSMLGSATMLRVLANVYRVLTTGADGNDPMDVADVSAFFTELEPHLAKIPVHDPLWLDTGAFVPGGNAPMGRQGSLKSLTDALASWAQQGIPVDVEHAEESKEAPEDAA